MGWTLREDLELFFGIKLPERIAVDSWAARLRDNPCSNSLAIVAVSSLIFYKLEKGHNPKVQDIWDAVVYCSTCLSVGYGDIFARTPTGKALGSLLMTLGPALAAKALDGSEREQSNNVQLEMLDTLKQILARLENPPPSA